LSLDITALPVSGLIFVPVTNLKILVSTALLVERTTYIDRIIEHVRTSADHPSGVLRPSSRPAGNAGVGWSPTSRPPGRGSQDPAQHGDRHQAPRDELPRGWPPRSTSTALA